LQKCFWQVYSMGAPITCSRHFGGLHEQGADDRAEDEEEGTEGQVLCSTDPGAYAKTEEEAQVPGQGGRGGTRGFEQQMNSPCLPIEALREPDTGGRMAALII